MDEALDANASSASTTTTTQSWNARRKRLNKSVPVACNECRRRKIACDGTKPICSRCQWHKRRCMYEYDVQGGETRQAAQSRARSDANQRLSDISNTLETFKSLPDTEVIKLTRHILAAPDPLEALSTLHLDFNKASVTPAYASRFDTPRPSLDREYELVRLNPTTYPVVLPTLRTIFCNGFTSMIDAHLDLVVPQSQSIAPIEGGFEIEATAQFATRLSMLDIRSWTTVAITDPEAIKLLAQYFAAEHMVISPFDTDLFITDLLAGRNRFCSELLVVSVLLVTCQLEAGSSPRCAALHADFLREARRLWAVARNVTSALNLAASSVLVFACSSGGIDDLCVDANQQGELMRERLDSFGLDRSRFDLYRPSLTADEERMMRHVIWAAFDLTMLFTRFYGQPPPTQTPAFQIPTGGQRQRTARSLYSPDGAIGPVSKLRLIEHEVRCTYSINLPSPIADHVPLHFVERKLSEYLRWADELDELHQRQPGAPYHVLVLHMFYHIALMDLLRPFVNRKSASDLLDPAGRTAEYLFVASLDQLKALAITWRYRQPFPRSIILWHLCLVVIVNCVLRAGYTANDRVFYLRLCVNSYFDILPAFPVAFELLKIIVCLAMHENLVEYAEICSIWTRLQRHDRLRINGTTAAHLVDLDLPLANGESTHAISTERLDALIVRDAGGLKDVE